MTPFSMLLNAFVLIAPCSWVCCILERSKFHLWIMAVSTLGLLVCSLIAIFNGYPKSLYVENAILGTVSLAIGIVYSIRERKKTGGNWTNDEE